MVPGHDPTVPRAMVLSECGVWKKRGASWQEYRSYSDRPKSPCSPSASSSHTAEARSEPPSAARPLCRRSPKSDALAACRKRRVAAMSITALPDTALLSPPLGSSAPPFLPVADERRVAVAREVVAVREPRPRVDGVGDGPPPRRAVRAAEVEEPVVEPGGSEEARHAVNRPGSSAAPHVTAAGASRAGRRTAARRPARARAARARPRRPNCRARRSAPQSEHHGKVFCS